jgi:hypothetical protein
LFFGTGAALCFFFYRRCFMMGWISDISFFIFSIEKEKAMCCMRVVQKA